VTLRRRIDGAKSGIDDGSRQYVDDDGRSGHDAEA
jgi:hypothetical protein